jgi:DNA-binding MurR/RpiR family transcriptional regulator
MNANNRASLVVTDKMRRQIAAAVAEIDLQQMAYLRQLTPAERVQRAASMIDAAERVGVYRLRQRQPELSEGEAYQIIRGGLLNYQQKQGRWRKNK